MTFDACVECKADTSKVLKNIGDPVSVMYLDGEGT